MYCATTKNICCVRMDDLPLKWYLLVAISVFARRTAGQSDKVCESDNSGMGESFGMFEVYTFTAAEGSFSGKRKLIGTVIPSGISSVNYSYDESYFKKPTRMKSTPNPRHFEVVFEDIDDTHTTVLPTANYSSSTPAKPRLIRGASRGSERHESTTWATNTPMYSESTATSCVKASVYQVQELDREEEDTYYITINNKEGDFLNIPILVIVNVTDINDNIPKFAAESLHTTITTDTDAGVIVAHIKAEDADIGINADLRYVLQPRTAKMGDTLVSSELPIAIQRDTGIILLAKTIADLVPPTTLTFGIVVKDNGDNLSGNKATATATISVVAPTQSPSITSWSKPIEDASETHDKACEVGSDGLPFGNQTFDAYSFETPEGILDTDRKLIGTVTWQSRSDAEYSFDEPYFLKPTGLKTAPRPKHFDVVFANIHSNQRTTLSPVAFRHKRALAPPVGHNSTQPAWNSDLISVNTSTPRTTVSQNISVTSTVPPQTSTQPTTVDTTVPARTGESVTRCVKAYIYQVYDLDREQQDTHYLTVVDNSRPPNMPILIVINVTDINDNSPVFLTDSLTSTIATDTASGLIVAHVKATDADIGINADLRYDSPFYTVRLGNNSTDSPDMMYILTQKITGVTVLMLDITVPTVLTFGVVVKDDGDHTPSNRATATATIYIVNTSDPEPLQPSNQTSPGNRTEPLQPSNQISSGVIGAVVGSVAFAILLIALSLFLVFRYRRKRASDQRRGTLQFMLDDETLLST